MALGVDAKSVAFRLKVRRSEMIRGAKAVWHGTGRDGNGSLTADSHVPTDTPYSFKTGFENEMAPIPRRADCGRPCWMLHNGAGVSVSSGRIYADQAQYGSGRHAGARWKWLQDKPLRAVLAREGLASTRRNSRNCRARRKEAAEFRAPQRHDRLGRQASLETPANDCRYSWRTIVHGIESRR